MTTPHRPFRPLELLRDLNEAPSRLPTVHERVELLLCPLRATSTATRCGSWGRSATRRREGVSGRRRVVRRNGRRVVGRDRGLVRLREPVVGVGDRVLVGRLRSVAVVRRGRRSGEGVGGGGGGLKLVLLLLMSGEKGRSGGLRAAGGRVGLARAVLRGRRGRSGDGVTGGGSTSEPRRRGGRRSGRHSGRGGEASGVGETSALCPGKLLAKEEEEKGTSTYSSEAALR